MSSRKSPPLIIDCDHDRNLMVLYSFLVSQNAAETGTHQFDGLQAESCRYTI